MKKKILSILLVLCMVLTLVPPAAFADGGSGDIFTYAAPDNLTYDGSPKTARVSYRTEAYTEVTAGAITVTYKLNGWETEPRDVGTYDVYAATAGGTEYPAIAATRVGSFTISPCTNFTDATNTNQQVIRYTTSYDKAHFLGVNGEEVTGNIVYEYGYDGISHGLTEQEFQYGLRAGRDSSPVILYTFTANGNYEGTRSGKINLTVVDVDILFNVNVAGVAQSATAANAVTLKENPTYGDSWAEIVTINDIVAKGKNGEISGTYSLDVTGSPNVGDDQTFKVLFNTSDENHTYVDMEVCSGTVDVAQKSITGATVQVDGTCTYTGAAQMPDASDVTVTLDGVKLEDAIDYSFVVSNNVSAGTATVTVTGTGNYTGTATGSFMISPKAITVMPTAGQSKTYGESDPALTYALSEGIFTGNTMSGVLSRTEGESAGTYVIALGTLTAGDNYSLSLSETPVYFTINKATQTAPDAPTVRSKTYNSVTLEKISDNANDAAAQYSMDGGEIWQDSPEFTGLSASTEYSFVARYGETDNYFASPVSAELKVTTSAAPSSASGSSSGGGFSGTYNYPVRVDSTSINGAAVTLDKTNAVAGDKVTITVTPDAGKAVDEVIVTDADGKVIDVTKAGDNKYTFTMPAGKVNIAVTTKTADYQNKIVMQIGNRNILENNKTITNDVAPIIVDNRTMVPIRVITETLGGTAHWDADTQTVTLNIDGKTLTMTIGQTISGFDAAPIILNDRTYVPVRYVAEMLGAMVEWVGESQQIVITK